MQLFNILFLLCGILAVGFSSCNQPEKQENRLSFKLDRPRFEFPVSQEMAQQRADSLLAKMSLEQKQRMVQGYHDFFIRPDSNLGIPLIYMSDASQGIHIRHNLDSKLFKQLDSSTAFPAPICLAATWNKNLAEQYARAIGEECRAGGIHMLLGPGMNIYRNPECGRNFEYLGEDPYLTARIVENYVYGLQSTGTMATLKHFVANNTEYLRKWSNSKVDERTLHEIYMPGFEAGIDAGAGAVMTAYNLLNGEWCGQSEYVIKDLLENSLGFEGLVMSDWNSVWNAEKIIKSGQDMEMPDGKNLKHADTLLQAGRIQEAHLEAMAGSILTACIRMGFYDRPQRDTTYLSTFPNHVKTALQTAREGIVLLKNKDNILPIQPKQKILVTGKYLEELATGLGSAKVEGYQKLQLREALKEAFGQQVQFKEKPIAQDYKAADVVLVSVGVNDGEAFNRPYSLPAWQDSLIMQSAYHNPNTVVLVNAGSGIAMRNWIDQIKGLVWAWYPGQIGNQAVAEILSGKVNPSGHLPFSIEKSITQSVAYGPQQAGDNSTHSFPDWSVYPEGKPDKQLYTIPYSETLGIGYRGYLSKGELVQYYFGHGLSYTTFSYSHMKVDTLQWSSDELIGIEVQVSNTGERDGQEVIQVYIRDSSSKIIRPYHELKAFQKVHLKAGETKTVRLILDKRAFSYLDPKQKDWYLEPGWFDIRVSKSSNQIMFREGIKL